MRRADVVQRLGELVVDLAPVVVTVDAHGHLASLVRTARVAFGARSVSVAVVTDEGLRYVAADGDGSEGIIGTLLPTGSGIAGYVAMSGQSLAVDRAANDPRFARAVAEATGYIPTTLLAVPVADDADDVVGVLSVLDRSTTTVDSIALASAFAAQAALLIPTLVELGRESRLLLDAVADAARRSDPDLGDALRRALERRGDDDAELIRAAAILADLRRADRATRARVVTVLADVTALATARRRR
jgi:signal transduction protein with GAF and PtsI domain